MSKVKRQGYREGSVYKRARDGKWCATLEAGWTESGGRRRVTITAKTEAEVKRKLRDKKAEIAKAGTVVPGRRITVKAWADEWLPIVARTMKPKGYEASEGAVRKWIVPTIGTRLLSEVGPKEVRAVADAQRKEGLAPTTILRRQRVLVKMLRDALAEGHAVPEAIFNMKAPGKGPRTQDAVPLDQALLVLAEALRRPDKSRWVVAFLQGMRQGECLGLTWDRCDFDKGLITVDWQLQALRYVDPKNKALGFRVPDNYEARQLSRQLHLVRPKSQEGWRVLPMVPWVREGLLAWREECEFPDPHGLVWRRPDGRPIAKADDTAVWHALQAAAKVAHPSGRAWRGHEARHATATVLMELNVPETVRIAIMGHSSIAVTRGYEHADTTMKREALERVAERLQLDR